MQYWKMLERLAAICLSLAALSLLAATAPGLVSAQNAQSAKTQRGGPVAAATHGPSARVVQAGAGTDGTETNGNSGPKSKPQGDKMPASPQPSLCKTYKGAVRTSCLQTVVGAREPASAAPHSGSHTP